MFDYFKKINEIINLLINLDTRLTKIESDIKLLGQKTGIITASKPISFPDNYGGESGSIIDRVLRLEYEVLNHNGQRGEHLLPRVDAIEDKIGIFK